MGAVRGDALPCCPLEEVVQGKAGGECTEGEVEMYGANEVVSTRNERRFWSKCKVYSQINQQWDRGVSGKHSQLSAVGRASPDPSKHQDDHQGRGRHVTVSRRNGS